MLYPHVLKLWVTSPDLPPGTQDADTGKWTANPDATDVVLYDGPADVQDTMRRTARDDAGRPTPNADATAFLADDDVLSGGAISVLSTDDGDALVTDDSADPLFLVISDRIRVKANVSAEITYEDGSVERANVVGFRRLDGCVFLRRLLGTG